MSLAYNKWIPDTRLRLINFGKGTLEVTVTISPDKEKTGKKIIVHPYSDELVMLRDLLPPGTDIASINDTNLKFSLKNIGTEQSSFQVEEYGPFKNTLAPAVSPSFKAQDLIDYLQRVIEEADFYTMDELLAIETPEHYKNVAHLFGMASLLKGRMATSLFRFDEADQYFEAAWTDLDKETQLGCCFYWSTALMSKMMRPDISLAEKGKAIQKAVEILDRIPAVTENNEFTEFDQIAAKCRVVFCLCYLAEEEEALAILEDINYVVIPDKDFNNTLLTNLFGSIHYGFAVALELKNGLLLKNLSRIIANQHRAFENEPSPVRSMRIAITAAVQKERTEPAQGFQNLFKNGHHFAPEFPNLRQFIQLQFGNDEAAIDNFIFFTSSE